ncbi:hypothetical protein [Flavobacterium sp. UMI-01]|uniref:hypothetical protein n=1 Tax=Flavobacterium sp. UMI-01 TaxID=1441053 RepID=UPI001C7DF619|nr:hypothetical protein [Flavobacterium sp. UMI-01]GIZ08489.1 hypothetical protein FUMI01_12160 [Flavobacterium sp. UMI-01]
MKKYQNECQNCSFFDNERHKNDNRTNHAGICKNWCEITFINDSCNQFLSKHNPEILEPLKPIKNENFTPIQTSLFFPI